MGLTESKTNYNKMSEGRLYTRGIFTGYTGGLKVQHENQAIVKLEGVNDKAGTACYLGKSHARTWCFRKRQSQVFIQLTNSWTWQQSAYYALLTTSEEHFSKRFCLINF